VTSESSPSLELELSLFESSSLTARPLALALGDVLLVPEPVAAPVLDFGKKFQFILQYVLRLRQTASPLNNSQISVGLGSGFAGGIGQQVSLCSVYSQRCHDV